MNNDSFFQAVRLDCLAQLQGRKGLNDYFSSVIFGRGFHTLLSYRLQRALIKIPGVGKIIAKFLRYVSCAFTGCDISYHAILSPGIYMPHPTGIVIGDFVSVGCGTTILQQVTLGTKTKNGKDYPHVGNNVYLGAGCKVIGLISINDNCIIGANSVVLENIPENATAVGVPARIIYANRNNH
ncbi:MAG: serine acetyltransferase [Alphaproteobacteria bacterium]|nr:serine acetyltransferase [Alphaproteobacteria bacterium]MBP6366713.1 serine acetyltransferase [Nitrosomonas sp.]